MIMKKRFDYTNHLARPLTGKVSNKEYSSIPVSKSNKNTLFLI